MDNNNKTAFFDFRFILENYIEGGLFDFKNWVLSPETDVKINKKLNNYKKNFKKKKIQKEKNKQKIFL
ncbi:hypothetical protein [Candidatus Phytoplasma pruni]|uniref:Uncharacterized protein n=1 Tax=Candidatus Phytoplasma pruni TaxID=479893 RepID=A0A851HIT1_9MOLU|nr:hypothetical protein [Candidatus Phytoplasma pruni]NWN45733.1 hypothetical protein [Candidatus Phytoplasma pruni]